MLPNGIVAVLALMLLSIFTLLDFWLKQLGIAVLVNIPNIRVIVLVKELHKFVFRHLSLSFV